MHPSELGRYRIVKPLGRGGMGVVYEAHDPRIDRPVAIKTIALSGLDARETAVFEARFEAEMRFAGRLQHQNIAALYDTGRDGDTAYIVMELVRGQDLRRLLSAGRRFSPAEAVAIVGQLLAALDYAHRRQVIHRDVKPANVMLQDDGLVKLCDFGVARPADAEATRTQGVMVGSLHYASPEQIAGAPIDIRTDLFSTGALLFELLTGERPFKGGSDAEVLNRIAHAEAPSCRDLVPDLPPEVEAAIRRALAKRPEDRFASAEQFAEALGVPAWSTGGTGSLAFRPVPPAEPTRTPGAVTAAPPPPSARGLRPVWMVGAGAVLAGLAWLLLGRSPAGPAAGAVDAPRVAASGTSAPGALAVAAPAAAPASVAHMASAVPIASPASPVTAAVSAPITVATADAAASAPRSSAAPPAVPVPVPPPAAAIKLPPAAGASSAVGTTAPATARTQAGAPSPAPAPAAGRPAESTAAVRVPQGSWQARLTCGPILSSATAKGSEGFSTVFTIEVDGPRLSWRRDTALTSVSVSGSFDEAGRFQAQGQGARKDRVEIWLERAEGRYLPASRTIVGQVRLLRPKDGSLARDCQLAATVGTAPPAPAPRASGASDTASSTTTRSAAASGGTAAPAPSAATAPGASPTRAAVAAPSRAAAPAGSERPAAPWPQGDWEGELSCGASAGPDVKAAAARPFVTPITVTVTGSRIRFTRDSPVVGEAAEGSIDDAGRFNASGTGRYRQQRGHWRFRIDGDIQPQPPRLQGRVQLLRSDDGSVARECVVRARPR